MNVKQVRIGGFTVGLVGLDEIFAEVKAMGDPDEARLKDLIFEKVKVRNYIPPTLADVYRIDLLDEYRVAVGVQAERSAGKDLVEIRVFGAGCNRCEELDRLTMGYIAKHGLNIDYEYVKDPREFARRGIIGTPALTVKNKIVIIGKVPGEAELERLLNRALSRLEEETDER